MTERRPAETIRELDLHLGYIQESLRELSVAVANMATKEDLAHLHQRIDGMATKSALMALDDKVEEKLKAVEQSGVGTTFNRWSGVILRVSATAAAVAVLVKMLVDLAGKLQ